MNISQEQKIGTHFKKESIFLATLSDSNVQTVQKVLIGLLGPHIDNPRGNPRLANLAKTLSSSPLTQEMVNSGPIALFGYDIFYKDENGYTRFQEEGPITYVGDNSDGRGVIKNVVSVWDYYSEDELVEVMINDSFMAILPLNREPLNQYQKDYSKG